MSNLEFLLVGSIAPVGALLIAAFLLFITRGDRKRPRRTDNHR